MKTKRLLGLLLLILSITGFVACSDDGPQDKVKTVKMLISDKTGTYQPWGSDSPIDCMLVKEEVKATTKRWIFKELLISFTKKAMSMLYGLRNEPWLILLLMEVALSTN